MNSPTHPARPQLENRQRRRRREARERLASRTRGDAESASGALALQQSDFTAEGAPPPELPTADDPGTAGGPEPAHAA